MGVILFDPKLKLKFVVATDLSSITYTFPGYDTITITGSLMISIAADYHRIWDGVQGHLIPPTWLHMEFEVVDGGTVFRF